MDALVSQWQEVVNAWQGFQFSAWKIVGFVGMGLFTSRWFVQLYYTRKLKHVVMPVAFWWLSVLGSLMLLAYFTLGKNDSVGILSNLFPAFVSVYNLIVHFRGKGRGHADEQSA